MDSQKPMSLLLIEDDVAECIKFKDCANSRNDITFIGMTGSSEEGIKYVKTHMPEGIILDLELHKGKGSGLQFLADLKGAKLGYRPIIVVDTNCASTLVYNHIHSSGVDFIFYKQQQDYSPNAVINTLLLLRKSMYAVQSNGIPYDMQSIESPEEQRLRVTERIDTELDLIGIRPNLKGRRYFQEAIFLAISADEGSSDSVVSLVSIEHKHSYSTVVRAMETAINKAWNSTNIEDLEMYYTARINPKTGVPTPTEFIYYYANKIRKSM